MGVLAKPIEAFWSILHVELTAIREALTFCIEADLSTGTIVSDCLLVVRLVNSKNGGNLLDPSCFLVEEITSLLLNHASLECCFNIREMNNAAHCVAKYATTLSVYESWLEDGPMWLNNVIQADLCNYTS